MIQEYELIYENAEVKNVQSGYQLNGLNHDLSINYHIGIPGPTSFNYSPLQTHRTIMQYFSAVKISYWLRWLETAPGVVFCNVRVISTDAKDVDHLLFHATLPQLSQVTNWQSNREAHGTEQLHDEKIKPQ